MTRFDEVLRILLTHHVDCIVVGGISAVLNGAPIDTLDLDIVHSRTPENIARLLPALDELAAEYRYAGGRKLKPNESHLITKGHQLLKTRFGALDVLGTIGRDLSYDDLLPHTSEMEIAENLVVRVLDLATLIETKEQAGREKDLAVLPTLRRTLIERNRMQAI